MVIGNFVKKVLYIASILAISSLLFACSSKSTKKAETVGADAPQYDTEKPTNFAEYKAWRAKNDPASEAYAEYKEWEIKYRRWKALQEQ